MTSAEVFCLVVGLILGIIAGLYLGVAFMDKLIKDTPPREGS